MPAITLPSTPGWQEVEPVYSRKSAETESPYTFVTQTQDWNAEQDYFQFILAPIVKNTALGIQWLEALRQLAIPGNYFTEDVTIYVGGSASGKSAMNLRLVKGSLSARIDRQKTYWISFRAKRDK